LEKFSPKKEMGALMMCFNILLCKNFAALMHERYIERFAISKKAHSKHPMPA
jgi:hypothetical protein